MNDNYLALSNAEKERFAKTLNYLLNKTYVLREIYEIHDRIGKFNPDYRFIERNLSLFEFYLDIAGYEIKKDDTLGIIELRSRFEYNLLRLDKFSTLMLVCLRQIYDEEIEKSPTKKVVVLTSSQLVLRMIDNNLVLKKPTIKEGATTLK